MANKKRKLNLDDSAVGREHLDGGTFWIRPMEFDDATQFSEIITRTEFERDADSGRILYNEMTREPMRRMVGSVDDQVRFAESLLDRIDDIDAGLGEDIVLKRDNSHSWVVVAKSDETREVPLVVGSKTLAAADFVDKLLKEMGASEVAVDVEGDEYVGADGQVKLLEGGITSIAKVIERFKPENPAAEKKLRKEWANVDFTRGIRRTRENLFLWVTRESAKLRADITEVERGNS